MTMGVRTPGIVPPAASGAAMSARMPRKATCGSAKTSATLLIGPAGTPDVEVFFSASGGSGQTWSVQSVASLDFLETHNLTARVVDGLLGPGKASVQMRPATADTTAAKC